MISVHSSERHREDKTRATL